MVHQVRFTYNILDSQVGQTTRIFEDSIAHMQNPVRIRLVSTTGSHSFEVTLDTELMKLEFPAITDPFEYIHPKTKCVIEMNIGAGWVTMFNGIITKTTRIIGGRQRRGYLLVRGIDWQSYALKKRILLEASFEGDFFAALVATFEKGMENDADDVAQTILDEINGVGDLLIPPSGIGLTADAEMAPGIPWPKISRDFSKRSGWDALRTMLTEIGAEFFGQVDTDNIRMFGYKNASTGVTLTNDDIRSIEYTETVDAQADQLSTTNGAISFLPKDRLDEWIGTTYFAGIASTFDDGQGPDGVRLTGLTVTAQPASTIGIVTIRPPTSVSPASGKFHVPVADVKEFRFLAGIAVSSGTVSNFQIKFIDDTTGGDMTSEVLPYGISPSGVLSQYDLYLSENFVTTGTVNHIDGIEIRVTVPSLATYTMKVAQPHFILKAVSVDPATGVKTGDILTELFRVNNTVRNAGDLDTMAERLLDIIRTNNIVSKIVLKDPNLTLNTPGYEIELAALAEIDLNSSRDLRIESITQVYKKHRITTTIHTSEIAGVPLKAVLAEKANDERSSQGYNIVGPG